MKKILAILIVTVMLLGTLPAALPVSAATIVRCEIEAPDYIEPGETITVNYITTFDSEPTDSDRGDLMFFNSLLYGGTPSVQRNVSGNTFTYSMTIPVSPEQALGEVTFKINYRYSPIKKRSAKVVNFDKISTWSDLETALKTDGNYKLTADVRPDNPYWADALVVPSGVDVVLDLNGHIIDRGYTEQGWDGSIIKISGNLTLLDSSPAATHEPAVTYTDPITGREMPVYGGVLKGGWPDQYGGGGQVQGGTFDMKGGSIACNSVGKNSFGAEAALGGGVYMQSGTFNMSGGAIVGNKAVNKNTMMPDTPLGKGGAVYIAHGTFTLSGGLIRGNCAGDDGGAVYVGMSGAFVMTGGIIVGNVSNSINNVSNIDGGSAPDMVTSFLHSNDGNDYTSEQEFPSTVDTTIATDVFVRDGYEFKGWAIAANSNVALADGAAFSASGDGHLWAKWEKNVTTYPLWIGGEQVTSRNLSGEGWSYDPSTGTLTLNSFNYSGLGHRDNNNNCSPIYSDVADGLTLDLKGTSAVEEKGDDSTWLALGVYSKGKLTVTGNGTINATSSGGCHNIGIYSAGDIVIDGGTVNAVAGDVSEYDYNSYGIYSIGSITINGGTVKGTAGAAPDAYSGGFFAYYDITVNGGSVTGTGGSAGYESWGLFSYYGNISINEVSGEKPTSVVAAGNSRAIESISVKSSVSGMGWNDASGEGDGTFIPVNTEGTSYDYRKVVFPHVHSFTAQTVDDKYLAAAATCTAPASYYKSCSICGEAGTETFTDGAALGHDYKAVVTEPTCTEGGYTTHTCERCGDAYTDNDTDALGHDMGEWQTTFEPTCEDTGVKKCECSRCDYFEEEPVDALGHDYKGVVTDPTCTEGGFTTHTCSRCGDEYVDTYTDPLGHDMGEWTTTLEPTCTEKGTKIRYCSRCDYSEDGEIDPLGHDFADEFTEDVAPTEETEGSMSRHCSRCDATTDVTEIPKILRGDVNGDGTVNMKDVLLLRKVLAGSAELELKYFRNSILDGEESISLKDLLALRVLIAGA